MTTASPRRRMDNRSNPPYTCSRVRRLDWPEASVIQQADFGTDIVSGSTARRCAGAGDRFCIGQRCFNQHPWEEIDELVPGGIEEVR